MDAPLKSRKNRSFFQKRIELYRFRSQTNKLQIGSQNLFTLLSQSVQQHPERDFSEKERELIATLTQQTLDYLDRWDSLPHEFQITKMSAEEIKGEILRLQREKKLLQLVQFIKDTIKKLNNGLINGLGFLEISIAMIFTVFLIRLIS